MENKYAWIKQGVRVLYNENAYIVSSPVYLDEDENEDEIPNPENYDTYNMVWISNNKSEELVRLSEIVPLRHMKDLSFDELKDLRTQITMCSIYVSDYRNKLGVPEEEVFDYADGFEVFVCSEYEDSKQDEMLGSAEEFAYYCVKITRMKDFYM